MPSRLKSVSDEINDQELFSYEHIEWTMLRTKNSCRVTMIAKSDSPINAMALYLSLEAQLMQWKYELGIMDDAPEVQ